MPNLDTTRRKLAAERINERLKLFASLFDTLATATIATGVIIPATRVPIELPWLSAIRIPSGSAYILVGQAAYRILQSRSEP